MCDIADEGTVEVALQALAAFRSTIDAPFLEFIHAHIDRHLYNLRHEGVRRAAGLLCRSTVSAVLRRQPGETVFVFWGCNPQCVLQIILTMAAEWRANEP